MFEGCIQQKVPHLDCDKVKVTIENRWYSYNGGIKKLVLTDKNDIDFICHRINNFKDGKQVRISHNKGYLTIFLDDFKLDMIFTYSNGIVYRVNTNEYVYDEELTNQIIKIMKIRGKCWSTTCL
ncbi:MAG: hypothetical protein C4K58_08015 [Flavobacteriaceae bacterium]|nr:MAG: hypothetical protein C4K58_08015 [Flavobacteriaceae bacterium]